MLDKKICMAIFKRLDEAGLLKIGVLRREDVQALRERPIKQRAVANLMGRIVFVKQVFERAYPTKEKRGVTPKTWAPEALKEPRPGWVIGFRYLQTGHTEWVGYEEGSAWTPNGPSQPCLLVSFWPTLAPVRVPLDGFDFKCNSEPHPNKRPPWSRLDRITNAEATEGWPRDAKGRWKAFKDFTPEENQTHTARQNELAKQRVVAAQVAREILEAGGENAEWLMREGKRKELSGAYVIMSMGDPRKERH